MRAPLQRRRTRSSSPLRPSRSWILRSNHRCPRPGVAGMSNLLETRMTTKVLVAGVGMVKFTKPGKSEMYDVMGARAASAALADAGVDYGKVQQAYAGFVSGDTCSGQTALYGVGLTGIPIINVNNACASGSTALFLARQAVASGTVDVALAVGFEQMSPGALASTNTDRTPTTVRHDEATRLSRGWQ